LIANTSSCQALAFIGIEYGHASESAAAAWQDLCDAVVYYSEIVGLGPVFRPIPFGAEITEGYQPGIAAAMHF
jgi:hypothetical protein